MRIISTLFLFAAVANALEPPESQVENHLRGANNEVYEDRDLLTAGATSTNFAFSVSSCSKAGISCFDFHANCMEWGRLFAWTYADADTTGNGFAIAFADASLWLEATCDAYALAFARFLAFTHVEGDIKVDSQSVGRSKEISLTVKLKTATTTFAEAESDAVADSYAKVKAKSYTDVAAFCRLPGNNIFPICSAQAGTSLKQIAIARAVAVGQSSSAAFAGSATYTKAAVKVVGSSIQLAQGSITSFATSFAFASAQASAVAFADSYTAFYSFSFAEVCINKHKHICGFPEHYGKGICNQDPHEACASAFAYAGANGFARALAVSVAEAYVAGYAGVFTFVLLDAIVDCSGVKPSLAWVVSDASVESTCKASA